ncbi:hypothetical protein JAAARDRAFT_123377 [Jaapia argillacea MUCL 33604]|uniref:Glutamyl-tRNA(Gln) amidotransferase subunit A, mitochondrial n=1 Tax=Jaapia argillacea MUCL 33604 TaxID=933084 RepID=A0A067QH95_9AGAM|nr:hypothetical protein JAAARDRAFT_123377 [Jaapia argillacea MUCL 33604]
MSVCARAPFRGLLKKSATSRTFSPNAGSTYQQAIESKNKSTNAFVYLSNSDTPPAQCSEGPLHGLPIAIKDNICTAELPTTCSSGVLQEFTSPFDATVVELLKQAGGFITGKTNCDEFGMGSLNTHSIYGPVVNPFQPSSSTAPWDDRERRSAGGSSGGSAAAVAAGMCYAALGTDTGGSVRLPASYCGVVGLKPSYGIVSRWGVISYSDSLDCVGILAKRVSDVGNIFNILAKYDEKDLTAARPCSRRKAESVCREAMDRWKGKGKLKGLRIGVPKEYFPSPLSPTVLAPLRTLLSSLSSLGATLVPVSLPATPYALSAYYVIACAEASSNLGRYDGVRYGTRVEPPPGSDLRRTADVYAHTRTKGFGREVQKRILLGTYALTADAFDNYFLQAQRVRKLIKQDFDKTFKIPNVLSTPSSLLPDFDATSPTTSGVDVLIHPQAIRTAPPLSPPDSKSESELDVYVQDVLTVPASLAGLPAMSVPVGEGEDGWPVGVSVVGQWGCDEMVLRVGEVVEGLVDEARRC